MATDSPTYYYYYHYCYYNYYYYYYYYYYYFNFMACPPFIPTEHAHWVSNAVVKSPI
jgi:hypothetical protein